MRNLKHTIITVFTGAVLISTAACGKAEDVSPAAAQPTIMSEAVVESREVDTPDNNLEAQDTVFTWKEVAGDGVLMVTTADIPLRAEPRDGSEVISTIPTDEYLRYDAICLSDDGSDTDLGYAKLLFNEEGVTGYIRTTENIEVFVNADGETISGDQVTSEFSNSGGQEVGTNSDGQTTYNGKMPEEWAAELGITIGSYDIPKGEDHSMSPEELEEYHNWMAENHPNATIE